MKKFISNKMLAAAAMLLVATSAMAEIGVSVKAATDQPAAGSEVEIAVGLTNAPNEARDMQFDISFPEAMGWVSATRNEARTDRETHKFTITPRGTEDGMTHYRVTFASSSADYVSGTEGDVFTFTLKMPESITESTSYGVSVDARVTADDEANNYRQAFTTSFSYEVEMLKASVSELDIENGQTEIALSLANPYSVAGIVFEIALPEGIDLAKKANGKVAWTYSSRLSEDASIAYNKMGNTYRVMVDDGMGGVILPEGDGEIVRFNIEVAETFTGKHTITVSALELADANSVQREYSDVVSIAVEKEAKDPTPEDPTAIEGIKALQRTNGDIYTIGGVKVGGMSAPGIYIVGGKKVVVK